MEKQLKNDSNENSIIKIAHKKNKKSKLFDKNKETTLFSNKFQNYTDYNIFIPLRVHSEFSLGKSSNKIDTIVKHCKNNKIPAIALTDIGNMFGALEFSLKCTKSGIQPISGTIIEIKFQTNHNDESITGTFLLLAKTHNGYKNLLKLTSKPHIECVKGSVPSPIDFNDFCSYIEDLIILMGEENSLFNNIYNNLGENEAIFMYEKLIECGADCYIEIQRYNRKNNSNLEYNLLSFAYKFGIPIVATNPSFFLASEDFDACDALNCISEGTYINVKDRNKVDPEYYIKSYEEMLNLFSDLPEAIYNTVIIAQKCNYILKGNTPCLPRFINDDSNYTEDQLLNDLSNSGLQDRIKYIKSIEERNKYLLRLDYELQVIKKMGFSGYFLIVSDFIKWSKDNNIPVGPGRGSGAGSIIAWSMGITDIDPIVFNLLFERFLNPDRVSLPDFDIDFCQTRRDEVIRYVRKKYGNDKVAHIITFGKLQARAVLRDVGRVLQMPYSFVGKICKMIPNNPAFPITLEEAIRIDKELQNMRNLNPDVEKLFNIALKLEGVNRHASLHAAGIVISANPLIESVPLYKPDEEDIIAIQFNMKYAEAAGLMKFDFLGLKTLTMIDNARKIINTEYEEKKSLDLDFSLFNDEKTYQLLSLGKTIGIFQFEGVGMRTAIEKLKPNTIQDLIALASLYRPGPMENIPLYINRKHGIEPIDYIHSSLKDALAETYGIIIYQEQVMQIVQIIAGFTLAEADIIRRAMGKKNKEEMESQRNIFIKKAVSRGFNTKRAEEIFNIVDKFAGYGFNKSHATAYAVIGYHTAYLKANYPHAFFIASINLDINDSDKISTLCRDVKAHKIDIIPPCINKSKSHFSLVKNIKGEYAISFGLVGIKGIGSKIMDEIIKEREINGFYSNIQNFIKRCLPFGLNKKAIEQLAKADVFSSFIKNNMDILDNIENIMSYCSNENRLSIKDINNKQMKLFDTNSYEDEEIIIKKTISGNKLNKLQKEYEALGFYLTEHPLQEYEQILKSQKVIFSSDIENIMKESINFVKIIKIAGVVTNSRIRSGKGKRTGKYAFIQIADQYGTIECSVFSEEILNKYDYITKEGSIILLQINARNDDRGMKLIVDKVWLFSDIVNSSYYKCNIIIKNYDDFNLVNQICDLKNKNSDINSNLEDKYNCDVSIIVKIDKSNIFMSSDIPWKLTIKQIDNLKKYLNSDIIAEFNNLKLTSTNIRY
ncbi:DNA polymerase III subunit alpha [Lyticum sinuosum]|uniref:DNA polymerase III subunit alpha n=1 Tax=Lyticum sinuosum TaxID=1332059 RepID=A0AAE4VKM6_9RICK|nr:DNA polymerase III subunit alpha [Lyticum sinuosum]MDZ5761138.1 DNA polymerase III subunit alpha [Lyticum sinuosum]